MAASGSAWMAKHLPDLRAGIDSRMGQQDRIQGWGEHLASHSSTGGRLLTAGNGGSAAEAQHFTAELVGRFDEERGPMSGVCLTAESSSVTALLNDYGVAAGLGHDRLHPQPPGTLRGRLQSMMGGADR